MKPYVLCLAFAATLAGCTPPVGDLGRARPSVWHDDVLPKAGEFMAWRRDEPVSQFPLTDDEQELRNRAWLLIMPASSKDNWESRLIELRRF